MQVKYVTPKGVEVALMKVSTSEFPVRIGNYICVRDRWGNRSYVLKGNLKKSEKNL